MPIPRRKKPKPALVDASLATWDEDPLGPEIIDEDRPPQFGMKVLLILPAVLSVSLVTFQYLGIFALLAVFCLAVIVQMVPVQSRNAPTKRLVVDMLWGVILPPLCLAYDPIVFVERLDLKTLALLFYVTQILVFLMWQALGRVAQGASACFAGTLYVGMIVAGTTGLLLVPISLIGILMAGVGVLGFTPFFTTYVFARNATTALRWAQLSLDFTKTACLVFLGMVLAVGVPLILYWAVGDYLATQIERIPTWK